MVIANAYICFSIVIWLMTFFTPLMRLAALVATPFKPRVGTTPLSVTAPLSDFAEMLVFFNDGSEEIFAITAVSIDASSIDSATSVAFFLRLFSLLLLLHQRLLSRLLLSYQRLL
jgi:hypothetical protein